jgi:hypothetical protein
MGFFHLGIFANQGFLHRDFNQWGFSILGIQPIRFFTSEIRPMGFFHPGNLTNQVFLHPEFSQWGFFMYIYINHFKN